MSFTRKNAKKGKEKEITDLPCVDTDWGAFNRATPFKNRANKKKLKKKAMKGLLDDYSLGNWLRWLKRKRGEL